MSAHYVRTYYNVGYKKGDRLIINGRPGTLVSFPGQYLGVRLDGEKRISRCHPTWEVSRETQISTAGRIKLMRQLTSQDFENIHNNKIFPFFEDENGAGFHGYGHLNKEKFAQLATEWEVEMGGRDPETDFPYEASDVEHIQFVPSWNGNDWRVSIIKELKDPRLDGSHFPGTILIR